MLDAASGAELLTFNVTDQIGNAHAIAFSRDGTLLAKSNVSDVAVLASPIDLSSIRATRVLHEEPGLVIASPVVFDQTTLGYVVFALNEKPIATAAWHDVQGAPKLC